ncbi:MAG: type I glyceraldehyde-3-phosphate dehydrogenase [Candidatus Aenigmatarchaeota archaeon]
MKVAINGFGRIGRAVFKAGLEDPEINFVAINDLLEPEELVYLLKHDSVYGRYEKDVKVRDGELTVDGEEIKLLQEKSPEELPWDEMDVDVACESTGIFRKKEDAAKHLEAGAKKVVISAPSKGEGEVPSIVYGVNEDEYDPREHNIVDNASCTTNSMAPMVKVLHDEFGIKEGVITTVHAYTSTQNLVDGPNPKPRRRRAAAENIIPTTTGAAQAVTEVIPELKGKLDGIAMRVPVPDGSVTDFVVNLEEEASEEEINGAFKEAARGELEGVLGYTEEEIVSRDIIQDPHSVVVDGKKTMQIGQQVKVLGWYDNEWGFSCRMIDVMKELL